MLGKLDIHCMDLSYWPNCHIRRIQLKFFKWPFTILGPFMGGGGGDGAPAAGGSAPQAKI